MKKIINSMLMLAMAAMTFVSCEDVPEPYSWPTPPDTGNEEEVITPQGSGTLEDPYNVAAAQALIQTLGADVQSEEIYVKGFISQIDDISPVPETTYGNATYWISDQKGSTAGQLEIYRGYSLGGEKFTSKDEIKEETPETMAGAIHGIAKTLFSQTADKIRYNREHAAEIAEQKRKDRAEEARNSRKMLLYMMGGLAVIMTIMIVAMKLTGAWN